MLTKAELVQGFKEIGVQEGDVLQVHSSYKAFGGVEDGPQTVIDALLEALGPDGTLIMPTFNFDFCKGVPWDARKTPSHMGIITELVRQNPASARVCHPIYSFSVLGKHKDMLGALTNRSAYAADSLFGQLIPLKAKIMVVGLSYNNSMTFFHHIEEMEGVDYRYMKDFTAEYTDLKGNTSQQTYSMLVRDIEKGVQTMVDPMGVLLEAAGVIKSHKVGEADVKLMLAEEVYTFAAREMRRDPFLLYTIDKEKAE